jgi:hypothetical protein
MDSAVYAHVSRREIYPRHRTRLRKDGSPVCKHLRKIAAKDPDWKKHADKLRELFGCGCPIYARVLITQPTDRADAQPLSFQFFNLLHVFPPQHIRHLLFPESVPGLTAVRGGGFLDRHYEDFCTGAHITEAQAFVAKIFMVLRAALAIAFVLAGSVTETAVRL